MCCTLLLLLHERAHDSYAPLWPIIYRCARMTLWTAYRSTGSEWTGAGWFGRLAHLALPVPMDGPAACMLPCLPSIH